LAHQHAEQIDAQAHITGHDDARMATGSLDLFNILGRAARRADDVDDARLRRERRKLNRRSRRREIDHCIGLDEGLERI
jgi:hypothetical protein